MYYPAKEGFSPRICAIDRCQVGLLRALATHYGARLYLKGGMAMRVLFGSLRLTKDIDFECDPSLSNDSLRKALPKALTAAALASALQGPSVSITKDTRTTFRAALTAVLRETGDTVHYDVEVSGRGLPPAAHLVRVNVIPPAAYRMAQFGINSFDAHAMAAAKVAALHSDNRSVPRDVFDLSDLIAQGADPRDLLGRANPRWLKTITGKTLEKIETIGWNRANEEVLPYVPESLRQQLDAAAWDAMRLHVAETVDAWLREAQ